MVEFLPKADHFLESLPHWKKMTLKLRIIQRFPYFNEDDPALLWVDDRRVLYTDLTADMWRERQCGYDPCSASSAALFDLHDSRKTTLMEGTPLCDYRVVSVSGEEFTARSLCRKEAIDWGRPGKPEEKMVKGHLPVIRR